MDRQQVIVVVGALVVAVGCSGVAPTATATPIALPTPVPTATPTPAPAPPVAPVDPVVLGKSLAARNGCITCHSIDGGPGIGPTWKGRLGTEETLVDGSRISVDDAYLRESILDPDAKIVKGFTAGIMPQGFGDRLSDEQIRAIIEYIKSVK